MRRQTTLIQLPVTSTAVRSTEDWEVVGEILLRESHPKHLEKRYISKIHFWKDWKHTCGGHPMTSWNYFLLIISWHKNLDYIINTGCKGWIYAETDSNHVVGVRICTNHIFQNWRSLIWIVLMLQLQLYLIWRILKICRNRFLRKDEAWLDN